MRVLSDVHSFAEGVATPPELENRLLEAFFLNSSEAGISDYYVHTPYFINLASGKENLREKSVDLVREELERSSTLGVKYMMTAT